jgi:hypothetical protein
MAVRSVRSAPGLDPVEKPALERLQRHGVCVERRPLPARRLPYAILRHPDRALVQREIGRLLAQQRDKVRQGGEARQPAAPAVPAARAETGDLPNNVSVIHSRPQQPNYALRLNKANVLLHSFGQSTLRAFHGIAVARSGADRHLAIANLYLEGRNIVGEKIEGAAAAQVEACLVPVAGQDPVLHGAAAEWKP